MKGPDIDTFRMFLFRVRDYITPAHLLILSPGGQLPDVSADKELTSPDGLINPLSSAAVRTYDAAESAMQTGCNIGCLVHPSGLMFLDFDLIQGTLPVPKEIIVQYLQSTLMIKTSSGRYRACFRHDGASSDNKLLYNGVVTGMAIRSGYVVCPGSSLPVESPENREQEGDYHTITMLNALPPARFAVSTMPAGLSLNMTRDTCHLKQTPEPDPMQKTADFCTIDGISLEFLRRKLFWVERAIAGIISGQSAAIHAAARDLARLGFDPGTITRILLQYQPRTIIDKGPEYAARTAYTAYQEIKSEDRIYHGHIVEEWLREEMNWRLTGKGSAINKPGS